MVVLRRRCVGTVFSGYGGGEDEVKHAQAEEKLRDRLSCWEGKSVTCWNKGGTGDGRG